MDKRNWINYFLTLLFFAVLAALTFRCVLEPNQVFSASDLNIGRLAAIERGLPSSFSGSYSAGPVMGGSAIASMRVFNLLLWLMPLELFANTFYGLVLLVGSIAMVWFLRIWGRSWLASVFGALIAFWFNSVTLASGGHAYKMEVLAFSVLGLCLIEKSVRSASPRKAVGFAMLAGLSVGIMMIEQQDVALLAGLFIGPYALLRLIQTHRKSVSRWVGLLVPIAVVALLLSGGTVLKSYRRNIVGAASVQGDSNEKWNYVTQWSMVPSELPDLIAPGWSGWSTGNPEGPYRGKIGRSAEWETTKQGFQNFRLDSIYMGIVPFLLAAFGGWAALRFRKGEEGTAILFWCVAALVGLVLAFGKYSLLYKWFFQLPLFGDIRAPIKLLDNFQICLAIVAAYGLDRVLADGKAAKSPKVFWIACCAFFGVMLLAGLKLLAFPNALKTALAELGLDRFADVIVENTANAWFHAATMSLICGGLVFLVWKGVAKAKWVLPAFVAVVAIDSLMLTSHYFRADDIAPLKKGNVLVNYLKEHQGDERAYYVDQSGIYNQWLASDGPYHKLKLFNIWQMPRMPVEYKAYLGTVGRNQIRLWQLSAVKHVAAPAQIMQQLEQNPELKKQFKPVLSYKVPTAQGMRPDVLLEFTGSIPRLALFRNWESVPLEQHCERLVSPLHDPGTTLLVTADSQLPPQAGNGGFVPLNGALSNKAASVDVLAETPSIVRFSQRHEPGWRVFVDGEEAELLKVDYLSMGVAVPPGKHAVEFTCVDGTGSLASVGLVFVSSVLVAVFCLGTRRDR